MAFYDLRENLQRREECGELSRVEREVDPNLEAGAIGQRIAEKGGRAAHFTNVKDAQGGAPLVGGSMNRGSRHFSGKAAIAFDCEANTHYSELLDKVVRRLEAPIKPIQVKTGMCKENILTGSDINLFKLPAPYLHEGDGGRYINTFGVTCTEDPDSDWVNWGVYRHMIHKKAILGSIVNPFQHIGMIYDQKYEARDNSMPFAIHFGGCPSAAMIGSMSVPAGVSEAEIAGGLRRELRDNTGT